MILRALAPGKVNLALFLGHSRADGRHELVTLFESVSLGDELLMRTEPELAQDVVKCPGVEGPNLAAAALAALRAHGWEAPWVTVQIRKRVPVAAGMGGGSADAAAVLRLAEHLSPLPSGVIADRIAAGLGADVPSQLRPGLVLGTGAGDVVEPRETLAEHALVIVPLPFALSTAEVYRQADRLELPRGETELRARETALREALGPGARPAGELLVNDLEPAARSLCPPVDAALTALDGADAVLVSGSGPTVAGVFWGRRERAEAAARSLREGFPGTVTALPVGEEFGAVTQVG